MSAKDIKKTLRKMEKAGFTIEYCQGSLMKIFPSDKSKPFYSLHASSDGGLHPMRRFFKRELGLDILAL